MPKVDALDIGLMIALYSTMLLVVGLMHMPPELTSSFVGEKITQAMKVRF